MSNQIDTIAIAAVSKEMISKAMVVEVHQAPEMGKLEQFATQGFDIIPKSHFFDFVKECVNHGLEVDMHRSIIAGKHYINEGTAAYSMIFVVSPNMNKETYEKNIRLFPMKFGNFIH